MTGPFESARIERATRTDRIAGAVGLAALVALALAPLYLGRADMRLLTEMLLYLSLASAWNLLAGYAGLISVGQHAYVGFGGYTLFALAIFVGVPPLWALPVVAIAAALVAVPVALLIFRLRAAYFAIGTWVIAEVFRLTAAQIGALGGGSGTSLPASIVKSIASGAAARDAAIFGAAFVTCTAALGLSWWLLRSRRGLALTAIRDNEGAAASLGIDIWRLKFGVYVVTAAITALAGALIFLQKLRITPDAAFSVNDWTAFVIFIVVIGGIATLEGPIVGTLVFFALRETLADLGTIYLLLLGAVAILTMLFAPKGLWGLIRARTGLEIFPIRRRVVALSEAEPEHGKA